MINSPGLHGYPYLRGLCESDAYHSLDQPCSVLMPAARRCDTEIKRKSWEFYRAYADEYSTRPIACPLHEDAPPIRRPAGRHVLAHVPARFTARLPAAARSASVR